METLNVTSNIPSTGFTAENTNSIEDRKYVRFNESAMFTLSHFSLLQVLHGRLLLDKSYGMSVDTALAAKLGLYAIESTNNECYIELNRKEVQSLKLWLEARMSHCEKERDERVSLGNLLRSAGKVARAEATSDEEPERLVNQSVRLKFNPDTYIAQKFLLLDIREWLLGEILD